MKIREKYNNPSGRRNYFLALLLVMITQACIREDFSACPPGENLEILFSNGLPQQAKPIGQPHVSSRADVFVFDRDSLFVTRLSDSLTYSFNNYYRLKTKLEKGKYHFVAWLNMHDCYCIKPQPQEMVPGNTHMKEMMLQLGNGNPNVEKAPELLFHGTVMDTTITEKKQRIVIPVMPLNYQVNFTVTGPFNPQSIYRFSILDDNSTYSFDREFAKECERLDYSNICRTDTQGKLYSSHTLMRITKERKPTFEIVNLRNGNQVYYNENIVELITRTITRAGGEVDFDKDYVFNIELELKGEEEQVRMQAAITINGWYLLDEHPEEL